MRNFNNFARAASVAALLAMSTGAHAADDKAKARAAIAEARGKIEAGDKIGASAEAAGLQEQARAALRTAEDRLKRGDKKLARFGSRACLAARRCGPRHRQPA